MTGLEKVKQMSSESQDFWLSDFKESLSFSFEVARLVDEKLFSHSLFAI